MFQGLSLASTRVGCRHIYPAAHITPAHSLAAQLTYQCLEQITEVEWRKEKPRDGEERLTQAHEGLQPVCGSQ